MRPLKALGQNFLIEPTIAEKIVEMSGVQAGDLVWEIGPGQGILTRALLKTGVFVRAIELDSRLEQPLRKEFGDKVSFIFADILKLDWKREIEKAGASLKLVANIPYHISSPLLKKLEENHQAFDSITLMLQKELAQRICAKPGSKAYGVMTLRLKRIFDAELLFELGRENFEPVPKVDSAAINLRTRASKPQIKDVEKYLRLIDAAFSHRRKTLRNNLLPIHGKEAVQNLELQSGINLSRRAETLDEEEFIALADLL
ncbi:MAG: 16S rRNA (adenine(1518)-N(6)/adenine(1519)-N(6))-dimethyltransferase RsmA [Candidatus Cloacimonadaceae bacterium]|nr:16S rRNA (adenine(1518)-N(6)/adenine(1519)-N(6))-dimethyltransferase RsmA [Candidatus Cloacimonadota bacterium]